MVLIMQQKGGRPSAQLVKGLFNLSDGKVGMEER
jgi:hypothetical protein